MKEKVNVLLSKADTIFEEAKLLADNQFAGSLTRAYYCAFQCVQALLYYKGVFSKTHQGTHRKFHELYMKTNELPLELGLILQNLFELRQASDYEIEFEPEEEEIEKAMEYLEFFIKTVKEYFSEKN